MKDSDPSSEFLLSATIDTIGLFLEAGAKTDILLIKCLEEDNEILGHYLIKSNVDVNIRTKEGYTPLMIASLKGFIEIVSHLLQSGANPNYNTFTNWTALTYASFYNELKIVKMLLNSGAKIKRTDFNVSINRGNIEVIKLLINWMNK
jgi:ankyrin repeat protein